MKKVVALCTGMLLLAGCNGSTKGCREPYRERKGILGISWRIESFKLIQNELIDGASDSINEMTDLFLSTFYDKEEAE